MRQIALFHLWSLVGLCVSVVKLLRHPKARVPETAKKQSHKNRHKDASKRLRVRVLEAFLFFTISSSLSCPSCFETFELLLYAFCLFPALFISNLPPLVRHSGSRQAWPFFPLTLSSLALSHFIHEPAWIFHQKIFELRRVRHSRKEGFLLRISFGSSWFFLLFDWPRPFPRKVIE